MLLTTSHTPGITQHVAHHFRLGQALSSAIHRGEGVPTFNCKSRNTNLSAFLVNTELITSENDKDRAGSG